MGPLSEDEARQLAVLLLAAEGDSAERAAMVAHESGGSPFFTKELTRYFCGSLGQTPDRVDLKTILASRLCDLPANDLRLLQILAVAGRPMRDDELLEAADLDAQGPSSLARLKAEHLIRVTPVADQGLVVESYHDRIREAVVSQMDAATLRRVHRRLADRIRATLVVSYEELVAAAGGTTTQDKRRGEVKISPEDWQRIFELGFHYGVAGENDQARTFALLAAEQARSQHALELAEEQYRIAERGARDNDKATRYRIAEGLGDVLMLRGRYEEPRRSARRQQATRRGRRLPTGQNRRQTGRTRLQARRHANGDRGDGTSPSNLLGRKVPSSAAFRVPVSVAWEVLVQVLHTMFPNVFWLDAALKTPKKNCWLFACTFDLRTPIGFAAARLRCLWSALTRYEFGRVLSAYLELAQAYAIHAPVMSLLPWFNRGIAYAQNSLRFTSRSWRSLGARTITTLLTASFFMRLRDSTECIEKCREAVRLLEQTGDFWEETSPAITIGLAATIVLGESRGTPYPRQRLYSMSRAWNYGDIQASGVASRLVGAGLRWPRQPARHVQAELQRQRNDVQGTVKSCWRKACDSICWIARRRQRLNS